MINFIGIGAQKSGTSWVYACLYEHPEICAPIKEIHFFSRPRFVKGRNWYESHFSKCGNKISGEFSTSYLYSKEAPSRIKELYPDVKLIAVLRNPVSRAISHYKNALKAGEIGVDISFETFVAQENSVLEQGLYYGQLERYYQHFDKANILVLIYEDARSSPQEFIKRIYRFLNVAEDFVPDMLYSEVNVARLPKSIFLERMMHHLAETMRQFGLDRLVHFIRKIGLPDLVRSFNTREKKDQEKFDTSSLKKYFYEDTKRLSEMLGRDLLTEWDLKA